MNHALLQAWEKTLRRRGAEPAVTMAAGGEQRTFAELDQGARRWLAAHTPDPSALAGRAVVFAAPNGIGWIEIFLGLLRAGALVAPLDAAEPPAAQRRAAESVRAGFWWDGTRLVALPRARRFRNPEICLIKLTSGSTGKPRPLIFTAKQMLADARQVTVTMGIGPTDINYAMIPLGHSYGLGNLSIPLLSQGVPLVCGTAPLPHAIAGDFLRWRPTVFPGVPAIWRALAAAGVEPAAFTSLRLAISAGAPLAPEIARDFSARLGRSLHNFYGSSETGGISFDRSGAATLVGSVGRPLRGVQVTPLAPDRIRVSSDAVFTDANRRQKKGIGRWVPPDRVVFDRRGQMLLLGRRGAIVKLAGRRVNLAEIETRLRKLTGVREVWVAVSTGAQPVLGTALVTSRSVAELRAELQADTAAWKIPKKWLSVTALPLNARGKTDTATLQRQLFG